LNLRAEPPCINLYWVAPPGLIATHPTKNSEEQHHPPPTGGNNPNHNHVWRSFWKMLSIYYSIHCLSLLCNHLQTVNLCYFKKKLQPDKSYLYLKIIQSFAFLYLLVLLKFNYNHHRDKKMDNLSFLKEITQEHDISALFCCLIDYQMQMQIIWWWQQDDAETSCSCINISFKMFFNIYPFLLTLLWM